MRPHVLPASEKQFLLCTYHTRRCRSPIPASQPASRGRGLIGGDDAVHGKEVELYADHAKKALIAYSLKPLAELSALHDVVEVAGPARFGVLLFAEVPSWTVRSPPPGTIDLLRAGRPMVEKVLWFWQPCPAHHAGSPPYDDQKKKGLGADVGK